MVDFVVFAVVGFLAQLIDGSLGMGYGVISSVVLLSTGVPPAQTSASVHAAKLFTTATSGSAHIVHGNVDRKLLWPLVIAGVIGGIFGAILLTQVKGNTIRPFVFGYLLIIGILIIVRAMRPPISAEPKKQLTVPLGGIGGFLDAIGGGGWGPVVTSSLIGVGAAPRYVIGSVNAAEFVVTCAVVGVFFTTLVLGVWQEGAGLMDHFVPVAGLIAGGIPAALIAARMLHLVPRKPLTYAVGLLIIVLSVYELGKTFRFIPGAG
jgi:uncharacterized membrane protein YfcA